MTLLSSPDTAILIERILFFKDVSASVFFGKEVLIEANRKE
jgi:hypothetical protein